MYTSGWMLHHAPIAVVLDVDNTLFQGCAYTCARSRGWSWETICSSPGRVARDVLVEAPAILGPPRRIAMVRRWLRSLHARSIAVVLLTTNIKGLVMPLVAQMGVSRYVTTIFDYFPVKAAGRGSTALGKATILKGMSFEHKIFLDDSEDNVRCALQVAECAAVWVSEAAGITSAHIRRVEAFMSDYCGCENRRLVSRRDGSTRSQSTRLQGPIPASHPECKLF